MTAQVFEIVPNFSEGRDLGIVEAVVDAMSNTGVRVVDWSADADHNRSVVTAFGSPDAVETAALAAARVAMERIDLRRHRGVHPRIGALDVLPFVPLVGVTMEEARTLARRVARRLAAEVGVPVFLYGAASDPPGRRLAELRRGGFEALVGGWPRDRIADVLPPGWQHAGAHPTAGATCVGARPVLLAWNVRLEGVPLADARRIAAAIRETGGGFPGLRALAFELPTTGAIQISMNLERLDLTSPVAVVARIEQLAAECGGNVAETEVVGLMPDELALAAAADRFRLREPAGQRLLSRELVAYLAGSSVGRSPVLSE